jgi:hypothetical protein
MDIGFETIGNATLIAYDGGRSVLVTDPWIAGAPYFGSWTFSHEIPAEQMAAIEQTEFVWLSHGHPDHLNQESLSRLKDKTILLPNHVGQIIWEGLRDRGYRVRILEDNVWTKLSENIRILCICDLNQDGVLLVDINGRLIVDLNDGGALGWQSYVRKLIRQAPVSFLLKLFAGEADMRNFFDEQGRRIPLVPKAQRAPLGGIIQHDAEHMGVSYVIPFSSFHKVQRADSVWVQEFIHEPEEYALGFASDRVKLLPAFVRYDCVQDTWAQIEAPRTPDVVLQPEAFGDNWSEQLTGDDVARARKYFQSIEHLSECFDFIQLRVGGKDHSIDLSKKRFNRGITFEAPRGSLMCAVDNEIFDDMLIGNFMKTTLHGDWGPGGLYPDFCPYVPKYADNGRAKTNSELDAYFAEYRRRMGWRGTIDLMRDKIEARSKNLLRSYVPRESPLYKATEQIYHRLRRL